MGIVTMSEKERRRLEVLSKVRDGDLSLAKAAELMGMSIRQGKRVYKRYREEGDAGLAHRLRGRPSNRAPEPTAKARILTLYEGRYPDFGPTLAAEYLGIEYGEVVAVETLRGWLIEAKLWRPRRRRWQTRRQWRPRKEHPGELVQMDGSHHDWFEGRRDKAVLMVMVDDATNKVLARFYEAETTVAAMKTFRRYAEVYGLPRALYVDRDSIYRTTRSASVDEQLSGEPPLTQFGMAMRDLGVEVKMAASPQAKGRVERENGVLQDRLVKAMRLRGISTLAAANDYLDTEFLPQLNERFGLPPKYRTDLHRPVDQSVDLRRVLGFRETRTVRSDWTIQWRRRWFQLPRDNGVRRGSTVEVFEQLDGAVQIRFRDRDLAAQELYERPAPRRVGHGKPTLGRKPWIPPADHPWKQSYKARFSGAAG